MAPPKKALIAVTSAHAPLYPEGKETGLFITEALHPFNVFKKAGFEVDLVSETGSYEPDWLSQQKDWLPDEDRKVWEDHSSEFRSKLDKLYKPNDLDAKNVSSLWLRSLLFRTCGNLADAVPVRSVLRLRRPRFLDRLSGSQGPSEDRSWHLR